MTGRIEIETKTLQKALKINNFSTFRQGTFRKNYVKPIDSNSNYMWTISLIFDGKYIRPTPFLTVKLATISRIFLWEKSVKTLDSKSMKILSKHLATISWITRFQSLFIFLLKFLSICGISVHSLFVLCHFFGADFYSNNKSKRRFCYF